MLLWTLAIPIVCVIPGLGYGDGSCFWSVGVSQSSYSSVLAVVGKFVTFGRVSSVQVYTDCFSVCFFRKVRYSLFPIVLDARGNGLSGFFTVCKKTYGNALRTFSIPIFSVVPDLGYCCTGLSWSVAVGDVAAIVGCSVISYFLLSYGVGDFLAVCIFRQIFEGVESSFLLLSAVTAWRVFSVPFARRITVMLSGRLPSWLFASFQVLVPVISVVSG